MSYLDILKSAKQPGWKYVAHWMPWHGTQGHVPFLYNLNGNYVPYNSSDPAIVADQIAKMKYALIDHVSSYYSGFLSANFPAIVAMAKACLANALQFSISVNPNAILGITTDQVTDQFIEHVTVICEAFSAANYATDSQNRPIIRIFDEPSGVDWNAVAANTPPCCLVFRNSQFSHPQVGGCFGWVNPVQGQPQNINLASINTFLTNAAANPTLLAWYPAYAGFDDSLASWSQNRFMTRGQGRTLKQTLAAYSKLTNPTILLPTWNDHEEGSGMEDGVIVAQ